MKRRFLLAALLCAGVADAVGIKLRPQGEVLTRAVQAALAQLSTKDVPVTLDPSSGPTLTIGGVGVSAAPFSPDVVARVVQVGGERRIEFNPQSQMPLEEAVKAELMDELNLKEWTPAAAQAMTKFGGADLNGDGFLDLSDLAVLMENYGKPGAAVGDLNQDRKVDDADVKLFTAMYDLTRALAPKPVTPPATTPTTPGTTTPAPGTTATPPATTTPATTTPTPSTTPTQPTTPPATTPETPNPTTSPGTTDSTNPAPPATKP